jgi:hypothetical protein
MPLTIPVTTDQFVDTATGETHTGTFIDYATLEQYTTQTGPLARQLDAVINRGVTLAIDPMVIASIARLGPTAPPTAVDWLNRLAAATNDTFALSYADSDITAPLQAGADEVLDTRSLDFAIDDALFAVAQDDPQNGQPDATADPGAQEPTIPRGEDLVAWDYTMDNVAWPRANSVVESDVQAIAASGFESTILASKNAKRSNSLSAVATIDDNTVFVADETISSLVDSALAAESESSWKSAMAAVNSAVAVFSEGTVDSSLVLTPDRVTPVPTNRLAATIDAIADADESRVVGLSALAAAETSEMSEASEATITDRPQSKARVRIVRDLLTSERRDARFATVAETPKLITGERRLRLLVTLSPGAEGQPGGWRSSTRKFLTESETLRDSVALVRSSEIFLTADRGSMPVSVENDLSQPVTVFVEIKPSLPLIAVENSRVPLTVEPGSQAKASVRVRSLSNGEVDLAVSLHTKSEIEVGEPTHVQLSVRAGWEGPVTIAIAVIVVLVFAFGIARTVIKRRAQHASDELASAGPASGDGRDRGTDVTGE